jgi:hypothetical protein
MVAWCVNSCPSTQILALSVWTARGNDIPIVGREDWTAVLIPG